MTTLQSEPVVVERVESTPAPTATSVERDRFRRAVMLAVGVFVVSRLCMLAATAVRAVQVTVDAGVADRTPPSGPVGLMAGVLGVGRRVVHGDLAHRVPRLRPPDITFFQLEARAAFFPVFPFVVRVVHRVVAVVVDIDVTYIALAVNTVMAIVAIVLIGLLARRIFDVDVAGRTMVLFAIFPGSFVLSYAYAEAIFLVLAMACLLALLDERWLLAGVFAAVGTADAAQRRRPHRRLCDRLDHRDPQVTRVVVARCAADGAHRHRRLPPLPHVPDR
ncbi:MAG: hypothetical protein WKF58_14125 [Ilumatobacteraceae bacterium]